MRLSPGFQIRSARGRQYRIKVRRTTWRKARRTLEGPEESPEKDASLLYWRKNTPPHARSRTFIRYCLPRADLIWTYGELLFHVSGRKAGRLIPGRTRGKPGERRIIALLEKKYTPACPQLSVLSAVGWATDNCGHAGVYFFSNRAMMRLSPGFPRVLPRFSGSPWRRRLLVGSIHRPA
jgi:hypothetical protein